MQRDLRFNPNRSQQLALEKAASGAADEQPLLVTPEVKVPQDWSPDGRLLLYVTVSRKTGADLWALPLAGERCRLRSVRV